MPEQAELILSGDNAAERALATTIDPPSKKTPLADLRAHAMGVSVPQMQEALAEYRERRVAFREWLRSQLVEGVHFGVPPGCEPRGNVNPVQWQPKPSLYAAGADFITDLLGVRDEYDADTAAWEQLGKPAETFVTRCRLFSRSTGELLGEGRGVRRVGQKGGDANNAAKMAMKSSKVSAVINTYGLRDLYTQDMEPPPEHDNPAHDPAAPKTAPRASRKLVTVAEVTALQDEWKTCRKESDATPKAWAEWCHHWTGISFNVSKTADWTQTLLARCREQLAKETGAPE